MQRRRANAEALWKLFDPVSYRAHNYGTLRDDDRAIISLIRNFFAGANIPCGASGVDVGSGANLYPSFAMLPYCDRIELREFSQPNVEWLTEQVEHYDDKWDPFWTAFCGNPVYRGVADPRAALARRTKVIEASIFDLPTAQWDVGTMFFVACSLSTELDEFDAAVKSFAGSLKGDAPFAAAFMENSQGYVVNGIRFPAVPIGVDDIFKSLAPVAYNVKLERIKTRKPLRDGYQGMILAMGRSRPTT